MPEIMSRLAREFVVRDIMVYGAELVCAEELSEAANLLRSRQDFDVIPIRGQRGLVAFLTRSTTEPTLIGVNDLVSESTSILDTVDLLVQRRHLFVLVRDGVLGYLHFSDLNRPIVKLPFFVLLEAVERCLFDRLRHRIDVALLQKTLTASRLSQVRKRMQRLRDSSANLDWASLLHFGELLSCAKQLDAIRPTAEEQEALTKVRNLVAHASSGPLVDAHEQVARLASARDVCYRILGSKGAV